MKTSRLLHEFLDDGVRFAPHYPPVWNSDHLPMTLSAMVGLGATDQQLSEFREEYLTRLIPQVEAEMAVSDWQSQLGNRKAYPALRDYFTEALNSHDEHVLIEDVLGETLPAIAMDAFHPIIRLGYARQSGSASETAASLAYLVTAHRSVPTGNKQTNLAERVAEQAAAGPLDASSGRFSASILALIENGQYPTESASTLQEIADVALSLYQSTRNFFALHLVTANQALRLVTPAALEQEAVASMTGALLASHLVLGSPAVTSEPLDAPVQLDPEHAYKYVWACWCEFEAYGNEAYLEEIKRFRSAGLVPDWVGSELLREAN